jgi:hypothetical protein
MNETGSRNWLKESSYLRDQAHRCVRLARDCPHLPTSHELEAIGVELMERAAELDELLSLEPTARLQRQPPITGK